MELFETIRSLMPSYMPLEQLLRLLPAALLGVIILGCLRSRR